MPSRPSRPSQPLQPAQPSQPSQLSRPSLAGRALLALVLMVAFYVLALAIAGALLFIPYAMWAYGGRVQVRIAFFCIAGAYFILRGILPRMERFQPPGPKIESHEAPRLFQELSGIAGATGQEMPAEVYLDADVNAWVSQRGGFMGLGGTRIMGVGLPLLQVLSVAELRGVIAHEFGHYYGGDTKLGPMVYRTRVAIGRTLEGLAGHSTMLMKPFEWYGALFLRLSHAVSRQQEYTADALAARVAGSAPMVSGLRAAHAAAVAYQPFWREELAPVLNAGYRPPIAEGFSRFVRSSSIAPVLEEGLKEEMSNGKQSPYDTHPPLRERIAALEAHPPGDPRPGDDAPAISLLEDVPALEARLLRSMASDGDVSALKPVDWDVVGPEVFTPRYRKLATRYVKALAGEPPAAIPDLLTSEIFRPRVLALSEKKLADAEEQKALVFAVLSCALIVAMVDAGWTLFCALGEPVSLCRDGRGLQPFADFEALHSGEMTPEAWREKCAALGVASLDLGAFTPDAGENVPAGA